MSTPREQKRTGETTGVGSMNASGHHTISGSIAFVLYPKNFHLTGLPSEDRYFVLEVSSGHIIKGRTDSPVFVGWHIEATGHASAGGKRGPYLQIEADPTTAPYPPEWRFPQGLAEHTARSVYGIGLVTARKLVDALGWEHFYQRVLALPPDTELLKAGSRTLRSGTWSRLIDHAETMLADKPRWIVAHACLGPTREQCIIENDTARNHLVTNPYRLRGLPFINFNKAEEIARCVAALTGLHVRREQRLAGIMEWVLEDAINDGHTTLAVDRWMDEALRRSQLRHTQSEIHDARLEARVNEHDGIVQLRTA